MGRGRKEDWEGTRNILYLHLGDGYRKERRKVGGNVYLYGKNYQAAHLRLVHFT